MLDNNPDQIENLETSVFEERGNRSTRGKTFRIKDENQQQTQPTYDAEFGNQTGATLVGGECSHHCTVLAPLITVTMNTSVAEELTGSDFVYQELLNRGSACNWTRYKT